MSPAPRSGQAREGAERGVGVPAAGKARARWLLALWIGVGAVVWLGVFDYVNTRGHKEYLYRSAELRLGIQPPPGKSADMREVLAVEGRIAAIQATAWAVFITGAGWLTIFLMTRMITKSSIADRQSSIP